MTHTSDLNMLINMDDWAQAAQSRLDPMALSYYISGADDEVALKENCAAFGRIKLAYRVLRGVGRRSMETSVLGTTVSMPLLFAPTAFQRLAHPDGEAATARAAQDLSTIMILSTLANTPMERVGELCDHWWFQLYVYRDKSVSEALVARAEAAGCGALVLTVDAPVLGKRERDMRSGFHLPPGFQAANMLPAGMDHLPELASGSGLAAYFASLLDPDISFHTLEWLRSLTELPIFIKGVIRPDDAVACIRAGAAGVIVSNHGGRQLDSAPATISALPAVATALAKECSQDAYTLLVDGGIRRGSDIFKALALGADAVLLGRPQLWGLAVDGQKGIEGVWHILRDEFDRTMALCGCRDLGEIDRSFLFSEN